LSFLLDTNVVSSSQTEANANAIAWWGIPSTDLFLSVMTLGEIRKGIEKKRMTSIEDAARLELVHDAGASLPVACPPFERA